MRARQVSQLWAVVLSLLAALVAPAVARADEWRGSARLSLGFGQRFERPDSQLVFAPSLRAEAMRPGRRHEAWRFGPAVELRTSGFDTFEGGAGLSVELSFSESAAFSIRTLLGAAYRNDRPSTATLAQVWALGLLDESRPHYSAGFNFFLSARAALDDSLLVEFTGGVEADLLFIVSPFIQLRDKIRGH